MPVIDSRGTQPVVQSGDLAFLEQKAKEGNLVVVNGSISVVGEITSFTPPVGKTFHLVSSKCVFDQTGSLILLTQQAKAELKNDGTVIESFIYEQNLGASGSGVGSASHAEYLGVVSGDILVGDGIKKYTLETTAVTTTTVSGTITGYLTSTNSQSFGGSTITINTGLPSENEVTQVAQDYLPQTFTDTFSTKGATKLYITRDIREIVPTTTVTMSAIQGNISGAGNAGDKSSSTFSTLTDNTGGVDPILRGDFGSLATRDLAILFQAVGNFSKSIQWRVNTDGDVASPTTWTSFVTFFSGTTSPKQLFTVGSGLNFRHAEVKLIVSSATFTSARIFEVFDALEGWGEVDLDLQILDEARSEWVSVSDQPTFIDLESWNGDAKDTQEVDIIMPNQSSQLRTVQVLNAKADYSMQISKTDPTF